jgi:putative nucleotidyltransferase with HDIG domain
LLRAAPRFARSQSLARDGALALLERLADEVDSREGEAARSKEIARLAGLVADNLGFDPERRSRCFVAARLHDLGKLRIPADVLTKPGSLTREEWAVIETHPEHGAALLHEIPGYEEIARIVHEHHERHNGLGYPSGKRGDEIALEARIIAVCAAWSAMRSDRPHRPALSVNRALAELQMGAGGQFDPEVVCAFFEVARREHLQLIELAQLAS